MLLSAKNLIKEYGDRTVFEIDRLEIADGDRIGLTGRNGAGKSTLLGILSGRIKADAGVVTPHCKIAELLQDAGIAGEEKGASDREEADGRYVSQMKIRDSAFKSGGESMRLSIAKAFSQHAPLLFADEPTTNLDVEGIKALEKMLRGFRGAVVLISHDRKLLDTVCTKIWELEEGKLRIFDGNYSAWCEQRAREREFANFEYEQYRREKKRLERNIISVRQEAGQAGKPPKRMSSSEWMLYKGIAKVQQGHVESRAKAMGSRLSHLEVKEKPTELPRVSMKLPERLQMKNKIAARAEHLTVMFGENVVLYDASFQIRTGKKTFLVGENGAGKSTLIHALLEGGEGTFITSDAKIGYFSQNQDTLVYDKSVLENVREGAVVPEHICRAVLMNLCMQKEELDKKISVLSGGERVKTALAKVLLSGCNFLILDEPANHCDIYTMEAMEKLLADFDGTALIVSHDRKLVENLADVILEVKDGWVTEFVVQ